MLLVLTDRSDAVLRDPSRLFGVGLAIFLVLVPAALLALRSARGLSNRALAAGFAALALARGRDRLPAPARLPRRPLRQRRARRGAPPGVRPRLRLPLGPGRRDARIGLAGTTAGFLGYGFYGRDLSNRVVYLGEEGPHGAFNAIRTCRGFRAAVNDAELDYLVTSPFLNFIDSDSPVASPEAALAARCAAGAAASSAAAPSRSGGWAVASTPTPAAPPTRRSATCP